jgi:hypothetical protein
MCGVDIDTVRAFNGVDIDTPNLINGVDIDTFDSVDIDTVTNGDPVRIDMAAAGRKLDELELLTVEEGLDGADGVPAVTIKKEGQVGVGDLDLAGIVGDGCEGHQGQPPGAGGLRCLEDLFCHLHRHFKSPPSQFAVG